MIMKPTDLNQLVRDEIDSALTARKVVGSSWVVHEVVQRRAVPSGADADFWMACAYVAVRTIVDKQIRDRAKGEKEESPAQISFPGYNRLQTEYTITRNGESCIVPTEQLTVKELRSKASEHRAMSEGHLAHADELEEYAETREREIAQASAAQ